MSKKLKFEKFFLPEDNYEEQSSSDEDISSTDEDIPYESPKEDVYEDTRTDVKFYLVLGPPGSGKSHLSRQLIIQGFEEKKWDYVIILSVSQEDYQYIDENLRFDQEEDFEIKVLQLIQYQKIQMANAKAQNRPAPRCLLVVDDPLGSIKWSKAVWSKIASTYRQWLINVIIIAQYIAAIPKSFYTCARKAFIFPQPQEDDYKRVYERFLARSSNKTGITNYKIAQKRFQDLKEFEFIVVDAARRSENPVTIGKADPLSNFEHITIGF